jgi:hypothetical protein
MFWLVKNQGIEGQIKAKFVPNNNIIDGLFHLPSNSLIYRIHFDPSFQIFHIENF